MKQLYALFAMLGACAMPALAAWDGTSAAWTAGDGSEASPYIIANEQQFAYFADKVTGGESYEGKFFRLCADLDMSADAGKTIRPIGLYDDYSIEDVVYNESKPFCGVFDGNYHTIDNITVKPVFAEEGNDDNVGGVGLFAVLKNGAVVRNLKLGKKAHIDATERLSPSSGGIAGMVYNSTVENCLNAGTVSGGTMTCGGIVGSLESGSAVRGCAFTGIVNGHSYSGGIVGDAHGAEITDCYNTGAVSAPGAWYVSGIVSWVESGKTERCYTTAAVTGAAGSTFLPGATPVCSEYEKSTAADCFYVEALCGVKPIVEQAGVKAITEEQLKSAEILAALNGSGDAWTAGADGGFPVLAWESRQPASLTETSIAANAAVSVAGGAISAAGEYFDVYGITGVKLYGGNASFSPSAKGIYIVVCGGKTLKVTL